MKNTSFSQIVAKGVKRTASVLTAFVFLTTMVNGAQARILFQDDEFHDIDSEGIIIDSDGAGANNTTLQFGNDAVPANNGEIIWDVTNDEFDFVDTLNIDGEFDASGSTEFHIRENADPASNSDCTTVGEIILDTTDNEIQVCTVVGSPGTWLNVASGSTQDFEDVYSADGDDTLTASAGFAIDATGIVDIDSDNATAGALRLNASNAAGGIDADAGTGGIAFDTTGSFSIDGDAASNITVDTDSAGEDLTLSVTGATDSSVLIDSTGTGTDAIGLNASAGGIDVDAAGGTITVDATSDNGISIDATESSNLSVATDAAGEDLTIGITGATDSSVLIDSTGTGTDAIGLNASAGGIDVDASGTIAIDANADNSVSIDATEASNVSVATDAAGEDLTIGLTGATDSSILIDSTGTGADAIGLDASAGGISIDAAESSNLTVGANDGSAQTLTISSTNAGAGDGDIAVTADDDIAITATNGGVTFDDGNLTGTVTLSDADSDWDGDFAGNGIVDNINDIATQLGGDTISTFNFTEANVLADNDTVYAALEKLDLRHGDLASTANGEGASLIGIEDAGGNYTGATVEAALTEIAADLGNNNTQLVFHPEYPDTVVSADGSNNRGRLDSEFDSGNDEFYYEWTSRNGTTQDIDLRFRFELPTDFTDVNDFTLRFQTGSAVAADNFVDVSVINVTNGNTTCGSDTANVSATWATITIAEATLETGCTGGTVLDAGDEVEILIKLGDNSGGADFARVGTIELDYDN